MLLALATLWACTGPEEGFDPALAAALQSALDQGRVDIDAPGAQVAVYAPGEGLWVGASGEADLATGETVTAAHVFRVGSVTKTFVAAAALDLAAEGALSLEAPLSDWLPAAPYADQVTIRQLLDHTAGYPDYAEQPAFLADLTREWAPEELVDLVAGDGLQFVPGEGFAYSNTHYALAGMATEAATGQDYAQILRERLLDPHEIAPATLPSFEPVAGELARGYALEDTDVTDGISPTAPWASGEMVADAAALVAWGRALYGGDVLSDDDLADMLTQVVLPDGSGTGYGLGCYLDPHLGGASWGHSGSTQGYQARLRYLDGVVVATLANSFFSEADEIDALVWAALGEAGVL